MLNNLDDIVSQSSSAVGRPIGYQRAVSRTIDVEADPAEQSAKLEKLRSLTKNIEKLGGFGPHHVNSPEWKNKMALRMKAKQFSEFNDKINKMMYHD